jgi:hypothetical protein
MFELFKFYLNSLSSALLLLETDIVPLDLALLVLGESLVIGGRT